MSSMRNGVPQGDPRGPRPPLTLKAFVPLIIALGVGIISVPLGILPAIAGILLGLVGVGGGVLALVKRVPNGTVALGSLLIAGGLVVAIGGAAGFGAFGPGTCARFEDNPYHQRQKERPKASTPAPGVPEEYEMALGVAHQLARDRMSKAAIAREMTTDRAYTSRYSEGALRYAVENVDADWWENARMAGILDALRASSSRPLDAVRDELNRLEFTADQIDYAIKYLDDECKA